MDESQQYLLGETINAIRPDFDETFKLFYENLFKIDPSLKSVFNRGTSVQRAKFSSMLSTLYRTKHPHQMGDTIIKLGRRHAEYGALREHFESVRQALMLTFEQKLGSQFTPAMKKAWLGFYDFFADIMKEETPDTLASEDVMDDIELEETGSFQQLIDSETLTRVHTRFYDWIFDDPWLGKFFWGKSKTHLINQQTKFMLGCFGGENEYTGEAPAIMHMHMYITDEMFDLRQYHLHRCILEEGVPEGIAQRWLDIDGSFRKAIVRHDPGECVVRCPGQMPIISKKPENYPWPIKG